MSILKKKFEFYDIRHLLKDYPEAFYYVVFGQRSNGKTYSALDYALTNYFERGEQFGYVRRMGEDIKKKNLSNLFDGHILNGRIRDLSDERFNSVDLSVGKFYPVTIDENGKIAERSDEPMGFAFDLNSMEHYKSLSYPKITTIVFDEFLTRGLYLPNEFLLFQNLISTIVRLRNNVKILMLGNTVNQYCPYFAEMGLKHIKEQAQGTVDVYKYAGNDALQVVVEYCSNAGSKSSDVYFAFDNPQLQMITTGTWEIAVYPHLPVHYKPKEVAAQFFVDFDGDILHGEVISSSSTMSRPFVFLHEKTTPIQDETKDIVYGQRPDNLATHRIGFSRNRDRLSQFIHRALMENRVFYSTNEVGEVFRNYIMWSNQLDIKNK